MIYFQTYGKSNPATLAAAIGILTISLLIVFKVVNKVRSIRRVDDDLMPRVALIMLSFAFAVCLSLLLYVGYMDGILTLIGKGRRTYSVTITKAPVAFWTNAIIYFFAALGSASVGIGAAMPPPKTLPQ